MCQKSPTTAQFGRPGRPGLRPRCANAPINRTQRRFRPHFHRPQRIQETYTTVRLSQFRPPATYPKIAPDRTPQIAARTGFCGSRPFAFLSDRTKAVPRSRRRPLYPKTVRGAHRPRPPSWARPLLAGSRPYGQGRQNPSRTRPVDPPAERGDFTATGHAGRAGAPAGRT